MDGHQLGLEGSSEVPVPLKARLASLRDRFALQWLDLLVLLLVVPLIGYRVWTRPAANEGILGRPLHVGIVSWPGYASGLVANKTLRPNKDSDFWKNYQLFVDFEIEEDEEKLRRKLVLGGDRGGLDVIWSTVDSLALQSPDLMKQGIRPRAFLQVDWSRGADAIVASADIKKIEQLKGRKIAVSQAASQLLFEYSLKNSILSPDDKGKILRQRTKGSEEARDLFINRWVDAAVLWEPYVTEACKRRTGAHVLIDTSAAPKFIADVMVADEKFIQQHPDVIDAFVKGWLRDGTTKALSDPMLAVQALLQNEGKFTSLGEETTRNLLTKVALATIDDNVEMFGLTDGEEGSQQIYLNTKGALFDQIFRQASDTWSKAGYIVGKLNPEQVRDERFVRELYTPPPRGCQEYETSELPIAFPRGRSELGLDAKKVLDGEDFVFKLRTHSGARFYVEARADGDADPQRSRDVRRNREEAVIGYLRDRYNLSRSQFVSASGEAYETNNGDKSTPCIHLMLTSPGAQQ
jgi:NitT/TauT family transport system substrate-binding protein